MFFKNLKFIKIFFNNVKEQADPALLKTVQWVHSQENLTGVAIYGESFRKCSQILKYILRPHRHLQTVSSRGLWILLCCNAPTFPLLDCNKKHGEIDCTIPWEKKNGLN